MSVLATSINSSGDARFTFLFCHVYGCMRTIIHPTPVDLFTGLHFQFTAVFGGGIGAWHNGLLWQFSGETEF